MARRRGRRVPYAKWVKAFAEFQTAVAKGYDDWAKETPETLPFAFGAVFRITVNRIALPKLHLYLLKGMAPEEAVAKALDDAVATIDANPEVVKYALERLGIEGNVDEYVKLIKEAIGYIASHLKQYLGLAEEMYEKTIAPAKATPQVAATATA